MADISENNMNWLKTVVSKGKTDIPAIVYATLKDFGYVQKVDGESAGRGRTVVTATLAGKQAAV